jgi:IS605 OrfB family transposase
MPRHDKSKLQNTERVLVKRNSEMGGLCRKQTLVYNQSLWMLRQEYFKYEHLDDTWKGYYTDKEIWYLPGIKLMKNPFAKIKRKRKEGKKYVSVNIIREMMRHLPIYRDAMPISENTIDRAVDAWNSYWKALKRFNACKHTLHVSLFVKGEKHSCPGCKMTGKPKFPRYSIKEKKSPSYFTYVQFSIENHFIVFPRSIYLKPIHVPRLNDQSRGDVKAPVKQVRIIPTENNDYWIECVRTIEKKNVNLNPDIVVCIDLGENEIATVSNNIGIQPICFDGGKAKEINHWYNIQISKLQKNRARSNPRIAELQRKQNTGLSREERFELQSLTSYTKQMKIIVEKRNRRINKIFHVISRRIINIALELHAGKIAIGHNPGQKQGDDDHYKGRRFNQNFNQLPLFKLIDKIKYKAIEYGIELSEITEEYKMETS